MGDFIWILFVIIALFNIINRLSRREKAGQSQPQRPPQTSDLFGTTGLGKALRELGLTVPPTSPAPGGDPDFPVPPPVSPVRPPELRYVYRRERPEPAPEPGWAGEGKTLMWHEKDSGRPAGKSEPAWAGEGKSLMWHEEDSGQPTGRSNPPPVWTDHDSGTAPEAEAVMPDLVEMLRQKDRLVAGFIFHEILERPRSLQKR